MTETKKTTTPDTSVGADAVQPLLKNSTNSITDSSNNCNLKTISMTELKSCTLMSPTKTELVNTTGAVNTPRKKKVRVQK